MKTIHIDTYLAVFGQIRIQVQDADGTWRYWQEIGQFRELCLMLDRPPSVYTVIRHDTLTRLRYDSAMA